ncbi:helix-turn-helix domain-containing protein [Bradyrhizobium sp. USDA 10063]
MTAISPNQLRAARAWLGWSRGKLCLKSGLSERAIAQYELGRSVPHDDTLARLRATLENAGIQFQFVGAVGTGLGIVVGEDSISAR